MSNQHSPTPTPSITPSAPGHSSTPCAGAPFRSGIAVDEYQLDPVVRVLSMPRVNLLIADDVGLGKTIEAGLVVQEMILRHRVRSVLIVCPSSLQVQWQEEMRDTFGLEFRIVDSESISQLRRKRAIHVNPWSHFPRLITSIDDVKLRARFANPSARLLPVAVTWLIPRCAVLDMGAPGPH